MTRLISLFSYRFSIVLVLSGIFLSFISGTRQVPPSKTAWVDGQLDKMTIDEKIGQFFMVAAYSNRGEDHFKSLDSAITMNHVGGLIFFQGQRSNLKTVLNRFQNEAKVPLLIGMDAEWGVQMRLFGEERFPYNYTMGAANDTELTRKSAEMIAQECRELGIHINFAPVADVNSNPNNPVIGFRSYGENPRLVAQHVDAAVKGMEGQGILTSIKHFPGHGDTDMDSHYDLPTITNSATQIDAIDFQPFRSGIRAGASTVMIGHLNVPALDSTGTPSSLSKPIIQDYLKGELGFKGLVISDALNMKAVSNRYGKTEVVVKAFQAGCDILLFPESVGEAIEAIKQKVASGEISEEEIDQRCRKILEAKYKTIVNPKPYKVYEKYEKQLVKRQLYEKAITVVKNDGIFPISRFDQKIAHISIGKGTLSFKRSMDLVAPVDHYQFYSVEEAQRRLKGELKDYDLIITAFHCNTVRPRNDYGLPKGWKQWLKDLPDTKKALILMGNPLALKSFDDRQMDAVVVGYENHPEAQGRMGQFIMGTFEVNGKLPMTMNQYYKRDHGLNVAWAGRLKESQPEELGISRTKLMEIDRIVDRGIREGAFPGCQVVVAIDGKVIIRRSYGYHTYDEKRPVRNNDVYDLASITKVAASTASLMKLQSDTLFSLDKRLSDYLPKMMQGSRYGQIRLRDMMAHQAGLVAWIPFYKRTLYAHKPSPQWYVSAKRENYVEVADDLWMKQAYTDTMYQRILRTPLKSRRYKYSDLGYYFVRKIVQEQSGRPLDQFALGELYAPMGLRYMRYHPKDYFPLYKIPPTEHDTIFRKQLVHGYVHDPGAAMIGGVGGHAGLFSNAGDLAAMMQLFLNKGEYGGIRYIDENVIREYTRCQFYPRNRRGAGFDKPKVNGDGGTACNLVSKNSYGHSGFTGTLAWADPENNVNYVFLSNRVYPDAENWKIVKMNIRTEIQRVVYEALQQRK